VTQVIRDYEVESVYRVLAEFVVRLKMTGTHTQGKKRKEQKTYNNRDSLVVTDPTTSLALTDLFMGERTGSRAFLYILVVCAKYAEFGSPRIQDDEFRKMG